MSFLFRDLKVPGGKEFHCALSTIWGIGRNKARLLAVKIGLPHLYSLDNLTTYHHGLLIYLLEGYSLSAVRIQRKITDVIAELQSAQSLRGARHAYFLPVRGQRTRTNAGTMKRWRTRRSLWD